MDVAKQTTIRTITRLEEELLLPLPCPFCETTPIVRTKREERLTFFRCRCCRRVWAVPVTARPS